MYFDVSCLTDAGKALLTRASSGAKIIWGTCGCFTQQTPGTSSTYLTGKCASGSSSAVFESASNTATISCAVDNTESGLTAGYANSFGLWAKIDGDDDETLVLIAFVTTAHPSYFPTYSGASSKVGAIIDISVSVSDGVVSTINLTESAYALASNLQTEIDAREALENRVVTTHSASSQTTGVQQTIYGLKNFCNGVRLFGSPNPASQLYISHVNALNVGWRIASYDGSGNNYPFVISSDRELKLETGNGYPVKINGELSVNDIYLMGTLFVEASKKISVSSTSSIELADYSSIKLRDDTCYISFNGVKLKSVTESNGTMLHVDSRFIAPNATIQNEITAATVDATTVNATNVYADSLHGVIDSPIYNSSTSTFDLPVGAFVLAVFPTGSTHHAGETYNASNNSTLYALSIGNGGTFIKDTNTPLPAGKYRFCSSTTPSGENFALVQYLGNN